MLLIHGITSSADAWRQVIPALAERHTVIAPDLLGHGGSAKPRGDYSLGAYASGLRDLMAALGHPRATVVGHSMGGGIAMQLAYQFPERVERLALVSSGGLGARSARAARRDAARRRVGAAADHRRGPRDVIGAASGSWAGRAAHPRRRARHRARARVAERSAGPPRLPPHRALDPRRLGQRVSATDRLYLAEGMPTLIVWGERDPMIPAAHGIAAHALIPHSRLELFPDAGHYPFDEDPERFAAVLTDFVAGHRPAVYDEEAVRRRLIEGAPA